MRYYSWSDLQYTSELETHVVAVTSAGADVTFKRPSKKLLIRNEGPNTAFLAFDKDAAAAGDFSLTTADELKEIHVQAAKLAFVTASGETAQVRVSAIY